MRLFTFIIRSVVPIIFGMLLMLLNHTIFGQSDSVASDTSQLIPAPVYEQKDYVLIILLATLTIIASIANRIIRRNRQKKKEQSSD